MGMFYKDPQKQDLDTWTRQDEVSMWRNVVVIGVGFMFLFTAFQNMASLQSSLNPSDGIGVYTLAIIYATIILSCMFLPTLIIKKLKAKCSMVVCQLCYTLYIVAQFYPKWGTLIPASIFLGFAAAPMWSAKCTYLSQMGTYASKQKGISSEAVINKFFGIFFMLFQSWGIWGNIVSSTVLKPDADEYMAPTEAQLEKCGAGFVAGYKHFDGDETKEVEKSKVYLLSSIYLVFAIIGPLIILLLLDPLRRYGENNRNNQTAKEGFELLLATLTHFIKNKYQILIFPLTIWSGLEQGWFGATFTAGYITCPVGIHNIGYILICYAVTDAVFSFTFGWILKKIGRVPVFTLATLLNMATMAVCLHWTPHQGEVKYLYAFAVLWGMGDAVWQTQINAFYGVLFAGDEEPAFANYRLWESMGFLMAYLIGNNTVTSTFLYILIGWLVVSYLGYFTIELLEYKRTGSFSLHPCTGDTVKVSDDLEKK